MTWFIDNLNALKRALVKVSVFVLLAGTAQLALAVPMPPVLLCDGAECTNPGGYDLSSYNIPFSYAWPIAPTITHDVTVRNAGELSAANENGARITLQAGAYGDVQTRDDQEWILQAGAEIDYLDFTGSQRIIVRGESPRVGRIGTFKGGERNTRTSDILLDGIYTLMGAWTTQYNHSNYGNGVRVAIINSSINAQAFAVISSATTEGTLNDFIFAGNYVRSMDLPVQGTPQSGSLFRLQSPNRYVIVGNYFDKVSGGLGVRLHSLPEENPGSQESRDGYVSGNTIVGSRIDSTYGALLLTPKSGGGPEQIYAGMFDVVIEDNDIHNNSDAIMQAAIDPPALFVTLRNNRGHGIQNWPSSSEHSTWETSNNSLVPFNSGAIPSPQSVLGFTPR